MSVLNVSKDEVVMTSYSPFMFSVQESTHINKGLTTIASLLKGVLTGLTLKVLKHFQKVF